MAGPRLRGRTRRGRLRLLDRWLAEWLRDAVFHDPLVVDLGVGEHPWTTVELAEALPGVAVIGVESDPERLATARRVERPGLRFVAGDFDLPTPPATVLRVMNVVRQQPRARIPAIHARLARAVREGGLVIEGSCDRGGDIVAAHLLRARDGALVREGLWFGTSFARGFAPWMFRDQLPRDLRRRLAPAHARLFEAWHAAWEARRGPDPRASFSTSVAGVPHLSREGEGVAVWRPPGGIPMGYPPEEGAAP